jgi:hypothetical protein
MQLCAYTASAIAMTLALGCGGPEKTSFPEGVAAATQALADPGPAPARSVDERGGAGPSSSTPDRAAPVGRALAVPDAGSGWIRVTIAESPPTGTCEAWTPPPKGCPTTSRLRLEIPPEKQQPGQYVLGGRGGMFAYRDAQAPRSGAWATGCENLGADVTGELSIEAIDADGITGTLSGTGASDGPFRALRCPSCKGTGMECSSNAECCNSLCEGTCKP